jgi:2-amino-4-hydroxy-6-hydroxymethyldihydropteridine diphosphokinase
VAEVLLAFGGNLGDPVQAIQRALDRLQEGGVRIARRSSFYRTAPWGPVAQPAFVNACAVAETGLSPEALLALTQSVERELGREPGIRFGPRMLDIDILNYDGIEVETPTLTLPHPRLTERGFVLVPLAEIAPDRMVAGRSVREWAAAADRIGIEKLEPS